MPQIVSKTRVKPGETAENAGNNPNNPLVVHRKSVVFADIPPKFSEFSAKRGSQVRFFTVKFSIIWGFFI
jgi:hypothetical protein